MLADFSGWKAVLPVTHHPCHWRLWHNFEIVWDCQGTTSQKGDVKHFICKAAGASVGLFHSWGDENLGGEGPSRIIRRQEHRVLTFTEDKEVQGQSSEVCFQRRDTKSSTHTGCRTVPHISSLLPSYMLDVKEWGLCIEGGRLGMAGSAGQTYA